ncbi:MAG: hypothetical protein EAZ15_00305 [Sphingobacteriales bacterium]|nr:MAG: hypothetical protein EAZ15_00305 [Sphingobacteriales bacterium]
MILSDEIVKSILGLIFLGLGWLFKTFYDNYYKIRPRLYVSIPIVLYQQRVQDLNYRFTYTCEMTIKNNSEYTAENINFIFPKNCSVSDIDPKKIFKPNTHLKSYESLQIETHKTVSVHADKVQVFTYEGDVRV